jgi:uncharacterized protein
VFLAKLGFAPFLKELFHPLHVLTLAMAGLGGFAGWWLNIPAPWLCGAMAATILLTVTNFSAPLTKEINHTAMFSSGLTLGTAVTPETVHALITLPFSILGLFATSLIVTLVTSSVLVRYSGWKRQDAVLAAVPGALSSVMAVAIEEKADVQKIAIVQLFRLVMLVAVLPFLMVLGGLSLAPPETQVPYIGFADLGAILIVGVIGTLGLTKLRMSVPFILGPMLFIGALRGFGFFPGQYPFELSNLGFVLVGALIGCRFKGMTTRQLLSIAPAAILSFFVASGLGFAGAILISRMVGLPLPIALMSFAPGGLEAMTALAFSLQIDPVRVGVHHIARFTMIGIVLPMILKVKPSLIRGISR